MALVPHRLIFEGQSYVLDDDPPKMARGLEVIRQPKMPKLDAVVKVMSIKEFRELGLVQEINRRFLHPLGLALEVIIDEQTGEESILRVWDDRDNPEGFIFGPGVIDVTKADAVDDEFAKRAQARIMKWGFICQTVRHHPAG